MWIVRCHAMESAGVDGSWTVPPWAVSAVADRAYASDLAGRFVMSGNTEAPSKRGVDADALWTHQTVTDVAQHVRTCELRLDQRSSRNSPKVPQSSCLFTLFDHGPFCNRSNKARSETCCHKRYDTTPSRYSSSPRSWLKTKCEPQGSPSRCSCIG